MGAFLLFQKLNRDRQLTQPDRVSCRGVRDCRFLTRRQLDEVHRPHAAHVVRIAHQFAAWGVEADFAAVTSHPAAAWSFSFLARAVIVIDTVVVLTQHGQVRRFGVSTVFMGVDMVNLASIGRHIAIRPRTDEILRHG